MELEKLVIAVEVGQSGEEPSFEDRVTALFNPAEFSVEKTINLQEAPANGTDVSQAQFTHGNPASLQMELFFDTYESRSDVRVHTREVFALTVVEGHGEFHRPPICRLSWGAAGELFQGMLTSLNQRFTLFLADGTPVRATLSCTFKEWRSRDEDSRLRNTESVDVAKSRTVKRGDTLSAIAADEYNNAALWRPIARANGLSNPLRLTPGQVLAIPAIGSNGRERR